MFYAEYLKFIGLLSANEKKTGGLLTSCPFCIIKVRIVSASERTYWNAALIFPKNSNTVEKMFFTVRKKDAIPEAALETLSIVP